MTRAPRRAPWTSPAVTPGVAVERHARTARQPSHRFRKRYLLHPFDETNDVAAGTAPEAVKQARIPTHRKRGRLLRMEGAEPEVGAPAPRERDALFAHDRGEIVRPLDRVEVRAVGPGNKVFVGV